MMHELPPKMALVHYQKNKKDILLCGNLTPYENPPPHHSHSLKKKCLQKKSKTKIDYYGICVLHIVLFQGFGLQIMLSIKYM